MLFLHLILGNLIVLSEGVASNKLQVGAFLHMNQISSPKITITRRNTRESDFQTIIVCRDLLKA